MSKGTPRVRRRLLDGATNYLGAVRPEVRARVQRFLDEPTEEHWSDIHGIIVNAGSMRQGTIWQCVIAADPTFPRVGPSGDEPWARVPDAVLVARAIRAALDGDRS